MTAFVKTPVALAAALLISMTGAAFAEEFNLSASSATVAPLGGAADKPVTAQPVSYNGVSCDMVRAKVAESGVTAAYAYARYIGLSHRDITKVRKACAV